MTADSALFFSLLLSLLPLQDIIYKMHISSFTCSLLPHALNSCLSI
jgi:hypothetical protein